MTFWIGRTRGSWLIGQDTGKSTRQITRNEFGNNSINETSIVANIGPSSEQQAVRDFVNEAGPITGGTVKRFGQNSK